MFYYAHWEDGRLTAVEARSVAFCAPDGETVTALTPEEYAAHLAALQPEPEAQA